MSHHSGHYLYHRQHICIAANCLHQWPSINPLLIFQNCNGHFSGTIEKLHPTSLLICHLFYNSTLCRLNVALPSRERSMKPFDGDATLGTKRFSSSQCKLRRVLSWLNDPGLPDMCLHGAPFYARIKSSSLCSLQSWPSIHNSDCLSLIVWRTEVKRAKVLPYFCADHTQLPTSLWHACTVKPASVVIECWKIILVVPFLKITSVLIPLNQEQTSTVSHDVQYGYEHWGCLHRGEKERGSWVPD